MSKGLEALKEICAMCYMRSKEEKICQLFVQCEKYKAIEKELKALEIIKNKKVDIHTLYRDSNIIGDTFDYYNNTMLFSRGVQYQLTQEEYDLLKEVFL